VQERGQFFQIPLRTSVKMQLGSILLIAETLAARDGNNALKPSGA
jgi:hypothetical protein